MNSILQPDIEGTKRKNIIEIALEFTAMIRLFVKGSKKLITEKLEEFFLGLAEIHIRDDYEVRHRSFCEWFMMKIRSAERKLKNGRVHPDGPSSYGQAAKILDVAIKVYVYYCSQPTQEIAERILPFLHGAIDTAIMKHLKKSMRAHERIHTTTIKDLDEESYQKLQSLLLRYQAECHPESLRKLHPVQFDDILWREFARGSSDSASSIS
jgi:hypothetical protein